jgi:hypothetical protein
MLEPDNLQIINKGGWRDLNTGDRLGDSAANTAKPRLRYSCARGTSLPFDRQGSRTPKESGSLSIKVEVPGVLNSCK